MINESLDELGAAIRGWRVKKRYLRERMPEELMERARRTAATHRHEVQSFLTASERNRLDKGRTGKMVKSKVPVPTPAFSRVEISVPPRSVQPLAEVETLAGVKLRVFAITPETCGLLSSFCRIGGAL